MNIGQRDLGVLFGVWKSWQLDLVTVEQDYSPTEMPKKDWYLYVKVEERLYRLNISGLLKNRSYPERPEFELMFDFAQEKLVETGCMVLGSKFYFVGGKRFDISHGEQFTPSLDVFAFDPTCPEGPFISKGSTVPRLIGPKSNPIVVTLEKKIYVLETRPSKCQQPAFFEVFDPDGPNWTELPPPPVYGTFLKEYSWVASRIFRHFAWGHRIAIADHKDSHVFDVKQGTWEIPNSELCFPTLSCAAEYKGFLIGMHYGCPSIIAYELDTNGLPIRRSHQVLRDLSRIFYPRLRNLSSCFLNRLGDGDRMVFIYAGEDKSPGNWFARVAVFQVHISKDDDGHPTLTAVFEDMQVYDFNGFHSHGLTRNIHSAFVIAEDSNKHAAGNSMDDYVTKV